MGRRRFPLRLTLGTVVVGLLVAVVAGVVGLWAVVRAQTREAAADALVTEVASAVSREHRARLEAVEDTLHALAADAGAGLLPVGEPVALVERLLVRMRWERRFESMAFVTPEGAGAFVLRRPDGSFLAAHTPSGGPVVEESVDLDGRRSPASSGLAAFQRPQEVPWYVAAFDREGPAWTPLFERLVDGATTRACGLALRRDGRLVGVFGIGYSTAFGSVLLTDVWGDRPGGAALYNPGTGRVGSASSPRAAGEWKPLLDATARDLPRGVEDLPAAAVRRWTFEHHGAPWIVALRRLEGRDPPPVAMAVLIPEASVVGFFTRWRTPVLLGVGGLLAAAVAVAIVVAHRIARPLKAIADDLERVGAFRLSDEPLPTSRIAEVAVVADAATRMRNSLRSFSRYVPTDLVRDLLARGGEARLGGSVRPLTLFFSDVQGFTTMAEAAAPQALVDALGGYLDVMVGAIGDAGGTVDKFVGDAVVAFFNAPADDPAHAAHACRAALAAQAALAAARPAWAAAGGPAFPTRIGLHTGPVLVGNIGTPGRFAYTVLGDAANLAARLESLNKAYGTRILASETTRDAAGPGFEWRRVDRVAVAGRAAGTDVFELLGVVGETAPTLLAARDGYEAGLEAYRGRRFDAAARLFDEAARARPDDGAAPTLAKRSREFAACPPPAAWDGVHARTEK